MSYAEIEYSKLLKRGYRYLSPYLVIGMFFSALIGQISILLKQTGISKTFVAGEASSLIALGEAVNNIKMGNAEYIFAGGYEKANTETSGMVYIEQGIADCTVKDVSGSQGSKGPGIYPQNGSHMILSDGACAMLLEKEETALQRNITPYGEIIGFAQGFSTKDDDTVVRDVIFRSLENAEITVRDVNFVHGSLFRIKEFDAIEEKCIAEIFPDSTVYGSPASQFGNSLGAYGSLSTAISVFAMCNGYFYNTKLEKIPLPGDNIHGIILARGIDGNVASLVVKKYTKQ
jgi:3-oxoacyl-[acyl-carrier-protein] synthase II